jgi:poly-gamma-glutamate capsule biosynthesis protein CapA/YwtB (metallophosphatase superfamily)
MASTRSGRLGLFRGWRRCSHGGIAGYESFRDDLVLMYLPALSARDGALARLTLVPFQIRNFRLNRTLPEDTIWLRDVLDRESRCFGAGVTLDELGCLRLDYS